MFYCYKRFFKCKSLYIVRYRLKSIKWKCNLKWRKKKVIIVLEVSEVGFIEMNVCL